MRGLNMFVVRVSSGPQVKHRKSTFCVFLCVPQILLRIGIIGLFDLKVYTPRERT